MLEQITNFANDVLWGKIMIMLIILTGILYTVKLKGMQFWRLGEAIKSVFKPRPKNSEGISPYEALATALAGTTGTGNIVGVASAIATGGPGAVFWMWVSSFLGMIIKYVEVFLSVKYSRKENSDISGGPMYYIRDGLGLKTLSIVFAVGTIIASFGIGNITQIGSVTNQVREAYGISPLTTSLLMCIPVSLVVLFGYNWTSKVTAKLVPIMSILYIGMAGYIIWTFSDNIMWAFEQIFTSAFGARQVVSGTMSWGFSEAIRLGFSRGLFSNEAGLGSSPIAHGSAAGNTPDRQGLLGIFEVFADTIVVCTITALVVLVTFKDHPQILQASVPVTQAANLVLSGNIASIFMTAIIICFSFSTVISWCFYGCKCSEFLFGKGKTMIYRILFVATIIISALMDFSIIWQISDILNMFMAIPNLIALFIFALVKKNVFTRDKSGK